MRFYCYQLGIDPQFAVVIRGSNAVNCTLAQSCATHAYPPFISVPSVPCAASTPPISCRLTVTNNCYCWPPNAALAFGFTRFRPKNVFVLCLVSNVTVHGVSAGALVKFGLLELGAGAKSFE